MSHSIAYPAATAPRACTTCKKRKRACDKQLPTCFSCNWLQTCCVYEVPVVSTTSVKVPPTNLFPHQPYREPYSVIIAIQDHAAAVWNSQEHLSTTIELYFQRIHPWLPLVSRSRLARRRPTLAGSSEDSCVLLLACIMQLILTIPSAVETGSLRSALYQETKRLVALAECERPSSLDLVQCRLLVALYEINHGATDEAYLSLGICSRAGIVLGIDRHLQQQEASSWIRVEEERRTWWAIIVLDRYLRQQRPRWPSAVKDPSSSDVLPLDDTEWESAQLETTAERPSVSLSVSTPSHIRVGYFARLAQVSHLLGLVLNNAYNPTADSKFNEQEAEQLRRTLHVYAELLPREATATKCSHYCGVVMMCYSSQLILDQSDSSVQDSDQTARIEALTDDMIQMARELNLELELMGSELLRPLALFSIYQVAGIYIRQCKFTADEKSRDGIRVLLELLGIFDERWRVASVYRAEIMAEVQRLRIIL